MYATDWSWLNNLFPIINSVLSLIYARKFNDLNFSTELSFPWYVSWHFLVNDFFEEKKQKLQINAKDRRWWEKWTPLQVDDLLTRWYSLSCNCYVARRATELKFISQSQSHGNFHHFHSYKFHLFGLLSPHPFPSVFLSLTLFSSASTLMFICSFSVNSCIKLYNIGVWRKIQSYRNKWHSVVCVSFFMCADFRFHISAPCVRIEIEHQ